MFGSSYKTRDSDFIVDVLEARWHTLEAPEQAAVELLQINMDNGPEVNGMRPPSLGTVCEGLPNPHRDADPRCMTRLTKASKIKCFLFPALMGYLGTALEWGQADRCRRQC